MHFSDDAWRAGSEDFIFLINEHNYAEYFQEIYCYKTLFLFIPSSLLEYKS
jgi:hypothetical protein